MDCFLLCLVNNNNFNYWLHQAFEKKAEKYIDHKIKEAEIKVAKNIVKQYKNLEYNTIADVYMGDSK